MQRNKRNKRYLGKLKMTKNIIIVDKNIQNIKRIINQSINKIDTQKIKTFVATNKDEVQGIEKTNDISLILVNEALKNTYYSRKSYPLLYYRR